MRRFYLEHVPETTTARICGDEARHMEKVLRLGPGDPVELFDGEGVVYQAVIESLRRGEAVVRICAREPARSPDAGFSIVLCQAVVKSQRMDMIVEKCTELGVTAFQPFFAGRSVPRWDSDKAAQRVRHWRTIARAAVKQSGARRPPAIEPVLSFGEMVKRQYPDCARVMLWEEAARGVGLRSLLAQSGRRCTLLVGPEGGFCAEEAEQARDHGFRVAGLGESILRAETAAIVAVALAACEFGMLGD